MKKYLSFLTIPLFILIFYSCKKENEVYSTASLRDYYPLETGKYITYKLDSLIYLNFGTRDSTFSYEVKYLVDSLITDNLGRPAYRIFRFIRKEAPLPWLPQGTCLAVNTTNNIEFTENNLRYVKLALPVKDGVSWEGNNYIDTYSLNSELSYLGGWDYTYDSTGLPATVGSFNLDNTLTVQQCDEINGYPEIDTAYSQINFAQEKYAKGIGMVYRKFFHREYQPDPPSGFVADGSYGVTLTMIDHN